MIADERALGVEVVPLGDCVLLRKRVRLDVRSEVRGADGSDETELDAPSLVRNGSTVVVRESIVRDCAVREFVASTASSDDEVVRERDVDRRVLVEFLRAVLDSAPVESGKARDVVVAVGVSVDSVDATLLVRVGSGSRRVDAPEEAAVSAALARERPVLRTPTVLSCRVASRDSARAVAIVCAASTRTVGSDAFAASVTSFNAPVRGPSTDAPVTASSTASPPRYPPCDRVVV